MRDLALDGRDVIALLVERGRAPADFRGDERVGTILRALFEDVVDEPQRNERGVLLRRAAELVDALRPAAPANEGGASR